MMKDINSNTKPQSELIQEGLFIRATRRSLRLSQIDLSKNLGISQSKLSKIEMGLMRISIQEWFIFCELTGTPVSQYREFMLPLNLKMIKKKER